MNRITMVIVAIPFFIASSVVLYKRGNNKSILQMLLVLDGYDHISFLKT